ncbi:FKBP-type peptidyl-prolyl cis-trans isomerase [Xanthomonas fragariae]|uniref:FKBP-type peptidyl-prolyl cis-trans isomerase n=1 Tax=Xanthomonas fragariae TaxID=48664 RepID=UPI0022AA8C2E|nr:FKBP-type peptidyl-prolyl cis-trans isomerase [Xanthomonas fragariae]WAT13530.1 FKBP-type peptidyl-prolyl cis-trans isomerase [Xanthomonas fragariae]
MRLLLTLYAALLLASCAPALPPSGGTIASLERIDRTVGTGAEATAGSMVTVHYSGWLYEKKAADKHGKKFDSSLDRAEPFQFVLGGHQVIRGWDDGVAGMRVGGKRTLMIPPDYGYGDNGAGGVIPPGASLVFDVELLGVQPR